MKLTSVPVAVLALAASASALPFLAKRANTCNGHSELCSKKYSNVTFVGAHNSYSVGSTDNAAANQDVPVTTQLNDGVRLLQIQGHKNGDSASGISLCHTSCILKNGGTLESYAGDVKKWVQNNPNDVVTIMVSNPDDISPYDWDKGFKQSGLSKYAYVADGGKNDRDDWPTLKEMISSNKRVVIMMDRKADTGKTEYILPEFKSVFENPYDQRSLPFNCTADRYGRDPNKLIYLHNNVIDIEKSIFGHSYTVPNVEKLPQTNSFEVVYDAVNSCAKKHQYYPTFILVDYYDIGGGGPFQAAAKMNGVSYKNKTLGNGKNNGSQSSAMTCTTSNLAVASIALTTALVLTIV